MQAYETGLLAFKQGDKPVSQLVVENSPFLMTTPVEKPSPHSHVQPRSKLPSCICMGWSHQ